MQVLKSQSRPILSICFGTPHSLLHWGNGHGQGEPNITIWTPGRDEGRIRTRSRMRTRSPKSYLGLPEQMNGARFSRPRWAANRTRVSILASFLSNRALFRRTQRTQISPNRRSLVPNPPRGLEPSPKFSSVCEESSVCECTQLGRVWFNEKLFGSRTRNPSSSGRARRWTLYVFIYIPPKFDERRISQIIISSGSPQTCQKGRECWASSEVNE